jgi:hypothetical protein
MIEADLQKLWRKLERSTFACFADFRAEGFFMLSAKHDDRE